MTRRERRGDFQRSWRFLYYKVYKVIVELMRTMSFRHLLKYPSRESKEKSLFLFPLEVMP